MVDSGASSEADALRGSVVAQCEKALTLSTHQSAGSSSGTKPRSPSRTAHSNTKSESLTNPTTFVTFSGDGSFPKNKNLAVTAEVGAQQLDATYFPHLLNAKQIKDAKQHEMHKLIFLTFILYLNILFKLAINTLNSR